MEVQISLLCGGYKYCRSYREYVWSSNVNKFWKKQGFYRIENNFSYDFIKVFLLFFWQVLYFVFFHLQENTIHSMNERLSYHSFQLIKAAELSAGAVLIGLYQKSFFYLYAILVVHLKDSDEILVMG